MQVDAMTRQIAAARARIKRAWAAAVGHLRAANSVEDIAARIGSHGDVLVGIPEAARHLASEEHAAYVGAAQAEARWLAGELSEPVAITKKLVGFDLGDPVAVAWASANALGKIRQITEEQRAIIRDVLVRGARAGANPRAMAQEIRDSIGLTTAQYRMVLSYREALERGAYAEALDRELSSGVSDRVIAAARKAKKPLTPLQVQTATARYLANAIALRAETIARTEGLRVAHQGSEETFRQAIARGDLEAAQIERAWATSHLANVRNTHRAMDKQVRAFGESFETGAGVALRHPGDPDGPAKEVCNCACVVATRIRPPNRPAA